MALAHFNMLIHEFLNKDPDIVPEAPPLVILDKIMHKIDWCEGGIQLADIATKNGVENYLNTRMKYIIIRLDN